MLVCTYCTLAQHTGAAEAAVRGGCEGVGEDNVVVCVGGWVSGRCEGLKGLKNQSLGDPLPIPVAAAMPRFHQ